MVGPERQKILFLTGTRADYGKLRPLIAAARECPNFECHIFATGMHTLARYGATHDEIRKGGFENIFLYINQMASDNRSPDLVLANTIQGLAHYVREFTPDMIIVHGDRGEALAGAIVGAMNNILVAHVEGGELSGTIDELIRHAVSKLSHLHFVANEEARRRVIQMGERESSVFPIGSPDIDVMLSSELPSLAEALQHYQIPFDEFSLFMYHPVTSELGRLRRQIDSVVDALIATGRNYVVIYPNNDPGSEVILERLESLRRNPRFRLFPSIRFEYFLALLKAARAMIGNSSAGIREAPVYGVPTLNIGTRQMNRFEHPSIINVSEDSKSILAALSRLPQRAIPSMHFGSGNSAELFVRALQSRAVWATPRQKQFRDLSVAPGSAESPTDAQSSHLEFVDA